MRRYARQIRESDVEPTADEFAWMDRVIERYERRRQLPNRRARAALDEVFGPLMMWIDRQLRRWPRLYRWLTQ